MVTEFCRNRRESQITSGNQWISIYNFEKKKEEKQEVKEIRSRHFEVSLQNLGGEKDRQAGRPKDGPPSRRVVTCSNKHPRFQSNNPLYGDIKWYCNLEPDGFVQEAYADFIMTRGSQGTPVANLEECKNRCLADSNCYSIAFSGYGYHPAFGFSRSYKNRCFTDTDYVDSGNLFFSKFFCGNTVYKPRTKSEEHLGNSYRFDYFRAHGEINVMDQASIDAGADANQGQWWASIPSPYKFYTANRDCTKAGWNGFNQCTEDERKCIDAWNRRNYHTLYWQWRVYHWRKRVYNWRLGRRMINRWIQTKKRPLRTEVNPIYSGHAQQKANDHENKLIVEGENEYGGTIIDINNQARKTFSSAVQTEIDAVKKPMEAYVKEQKSIWAEAFTLHKYGPSGIKTGLKHMKELIVADDTAPAMLTSMYGGLEPLIVLWNEAGPVGHLTDLLKKLNKGDELFPGMKTLPIIWMRVQRAIAEVLPELEKYF